MRSAEGMRVTLPGGLVVERLLSVLPGVDLWWMPVAEMSVRMLSGDERERMARFRSLEDRWAFAAKRTLARSVLSTYAPVPPESWRFVVNAFGKPRVEGGAIEFSLSRSGSMVVCAVTRSGMVGVDIEDGCARPAEEMPEWVLGPSERDMVQRLSGEARREAFLAFWTLKEALGKGLGCGLSLPVERIAFDLEGEITVDMPSGGRLGGWSFAQVQIAGRYAVAIAASEQSRVSSEHPCAAGWLECLLHPGAGAAVSF